MSRRQPTRGTPYPEIDVVCTDRGQHSSPVPLDRYTDFRTATPPGRIVGSYRTARKSARGRQVVRDHPDPVSMIRDDDGSFTYTIVCRQCGRTPQRREENLAPVLDRLYAAFPGRRRYTLDISYMG